MMSNFELNNIITMPGSRRVIMVALTLMALFLASFIQTPNLPKSLFYGIFREVAKIQLTLKTRQWSEMKSRHFIVRFMEKDRKYAPLILETAEESYEEISRDLGYIPKDKVLVVMYPTREDLGRSFGWDADESAMGVYWAGVIRILSPGEWINYRNPDELKDTFKKTGPMAHEFAHLVIDYRTRGNYPRWFTEGIAQYKEYQLTGFKFDDAHLEEHQLYPLNKMDKNYDYLPNQSLAYRQSLAAVQYLVDIYGEEGLNRILTNLSKGMTLNQSFNKAIGVDLKEFEQDFKDRVKEMSTSPLPS